MRKFLDARHIHFPPEVNAVLTAVLDEAWRDAQASKALSPVLGDHPDAREILAKAIIAAAGRGERNPASLREDALEHLTKTINARAARFSGE